MVMYGYPKDLLGGTKLLNNYIVESRKNRNFRNIYGKLQMVVAFTQTHEKGAKDNEKNNIKGESHCFRCGKQDH